MKYAWAVAVYDSDTVLNGEAATVEAAKAAALAVIAADDAATGGEGVDGLIWRADGPLAFTLIDPVADMWYDELTLTAIE